MEQDNAESNGVTNGVANGVQNGVSRNSAHGEAINGIPAEVRDSIFGDQNDPICIVGLACRLPGDIRSPSELWEFLAKGKSAQGPVHPDRFNIKGFYDSDGDRAGVTYAEGGYFLNEDVRLFDNGFFGINNLEATYMDPQQRKLLEVAFECFENAGVSMEDIKDTNTGVFVGNFTIDFQMMQMRDPDYVHRYTATGLSTTILSNRISHVFDLHGPSVTLDTACSSSIYCLHSAISAIHNGDCDGALVAGANLITSPEQHVSTMKAGVLSPTSTCHTFDAAADGYGRGEGVNAVYIKPLSSALRDGNKIWSIIRSSAVNANGKTPGITQPSAAYQEIVIRKAYSKAGIAFSDTDYVECHGTGTAVGDPIEVDAISRCFSNRQNNGKLILGSVKSSLGHSEAASGLTSLIKVVLAFENEKIPPTYGLTKLNPKLQLGSRNLVVATELMDWPRSLRRAGINSFGFGGANSHVIVESFQSWIAHKHVTGLNGHLPPPKSGSVHSYQRLVIPVSAASKASLQKRIQQVRASIEKYDSIGLKRLCLTLATRQPMRHRDFLLVGTDQESGKATLFPEPDGTFANVPSEQLPFAFVFTGQGAQYAGMAKELIERCPPFRDTMQYLDRCLSRLGHGLAPCGWSLTETILAPPGISKVHHVTRSQPLCTAVQIGLVDLMKGWGISATAVVGHSSGEIAAAYAAGLLNAEQAILVAYYRGYALNQLRKKGAMIATGLDAAAAKALLSSELIDGVCIACVNSPGNVTLSGSVEGIETLYNRLQSAGTFVRKLHTDGRAYHSHMMKEVGPNYHKLLESVFQGVDLKTEATAKMFSSVGRSSHSSLPLEREARTAEYWRNNLEQSVQFVSAFTNMMAEHEFHVIEIGPHSALKGPINQIRSQQETLSGPYTPSLIRGQDSDICMKALAGALFRYGHMLRWDVVNATPPSLGIERLHDLPPYPWDYESSGLLWKEERASFDLRHRQYIRHELLGSRQLAGNDIDWLWRNVVRLNEVSWMLDHKIESQAVFPAAAYIAMAIEAVSQIRNLKDAMMQINAKQPEFEFRNINVSKALVLSNGRAGGLDLELHTLMSPSKLSKVTSSAEWYDFSITSWTAGQATLHCAGSLRVMEKPNKVATPFLEHMKTTGPIFDTWPMDRWYKRLQQEGLNYGPCFQTLSVLQTDASRFRSEAVCTIDTIPSTTPDSSPYYAVHPIIIDGCLQAGILSDSMGIMDRQRAWLPVFIAECRIRPVSVYSQATIRAQSSRKGFSILHSDIRLLDMHDDPLVDLKGVRLTLYASKGGEVPAASGVSRQRQPCLRVSWKPDITALHTSEASQLDEYIRSYSKARNPESSHNKLLEIFGSLIDLAAHKTPRMRVLEIKAEGDSSNEEWRGGIDTMCSLRTIESWESAIISRDGEFYLDENTSNGTFDVVFIPECSTSDLCWARSREGITSLVGNSGILLTFQSDSVRDHLSNLEFNLISLSDEALLVIRKHENLTPKTMSVLIVHNNPSKAIDNIARRLSTHLEDAMGIPDVKSVSISGVSTIELTKNTICISLVEVEREFLASMNQEDMDNLHKITDTVNKIIWLTGAGMLGRLSNADLTLSSGLSRALMLEQPALSFTVIDIGPATALRESDFDTLCRCIVELQLTSPGTDDKEFILANGLLYVSRFREDSDLNEHFRRRQGLQKRVGKVALGKIQEARLSIKTPGVTDTLHFEEQLRLSTALPPDHVDIRVKAVSLNAKDVYVMGGRAETREATTSLEFSGEVVAVGSRVKQLQPGDRVVVLAPNYFSLTERVPAWAAHKLLPGEDYVETSTLPVVYATALYALEERARLHAGESVMIHSGAGALGIAAISVAQTLGAVVYATAGSPARRAYLTEELGVPGSHVFNSRDSSFVVGVKAATGGRGVDVILNSLVGDLMHASWDCVAEFGRFIEVGKRELVDAGKLDMRIFLRNATFTAFDLSELYYNEYEHHRHMLSRLVKDALERYRAGKLKKLPTTTFDVAEISQAYRYFSSKDRIGKVVVSLENPDRVIPTTPAKYLTVFDPEKVYLMVGCLGGLGRSLARWMMTQGAQRFVFLGRSGCDRPSAKALVSRLESAGAKVQVVRGDVVNADDVINAVQACVATGKLIGGVVQAAMGLQEALFSRMTNSSWQKGVQPKWSGTWNIHNALEGHDEALDFLLLTSSVSGTVGTATESNYCAANGFLDAFAQWRRNQGKPAISIGLGMISEVGYLHENPEVENLLLRKGIQPLNEDEFLQVVDLGLAQGDSKADGIQSPNDSSVAHILTGLELSKMEELIAQGFDISFGVLRDPRAALLAASSVAMREERDSTLRNTLESDGSAEIPWLKGLPPQVADITKKIDAASLDDAILIVVRKQFSNLTLMPIQQIDDRKPLVQFGLDSMIASEFRAWLWSTLKVDVSFLDILSRKLTLRGLAKSITEDLPRV